MSVENLKDDRDYELPAGTDSVWVGVDGFSVYVRRTDEGVVVDILQKGREMDGAISSAYAYTGELEAEDAV